MAEFAVNIVLKAQDEATAVVRKLIGETRKIRNVRAPMLGGVGEGGGGLVSSGRRGRGAGPRDVMFPGFDFTGHRVAAHLAGASANLHRLTEKTKRALGAPIELAMDFEQAMAEVRAVTTDAQIGDNFDRLTAKARELGASTEFTASQAASALKFMGIAGWDTSKQLATISPMLDAATISGLDLGRTSDIITDVMGGFGLEAGRMRNGVDEARFAVDTMIATTLNANTNLDALGRGLFKVGPLAAKVGVEFNEVNAMLGVLANAGIKGAEGGTALRNIMLSLSGKPSKDMRKLLKAMGLDSKQLRKELGKTGIAGAMGLLMTQMEKMSPEMQLFASNVLFGRRTAVSATNVLSKLTTEYAGLKQKLDDSGGAAAATAEQFRSTSKAATKELKSALEELGITVGEELMPVLRPLIKDAIDAARSFGAWAKENPALVRTLGKVMMGVVALGTVLSPVLLTLSSTVSIVAFTRALQGLGAAGTAAGAGISTLGRALIFAAGAASIAAATAAAAWLIIDTAQNKIEGLKDTSVGLAKDNTKAMGSAATKMSDEDLDRMLGSTDEKIAKLERMRQREQRDRGLFGQLFHRGRDDTAEVIEEMQRQKAELRSEQIRRKAAKFNAAKGGGAETVAQQREVERIEKNIDKLDAEGTKVDASGEIRVVIDDQRTRVKSVKSKDIPIAVESGVVPGGL